MPGIITLFSHAFFALTGVTYVAKRRGFENPDSEGRGSKLLKIFIDNI